MATKETMLNYKYYRHVAEQTNTSKNIFGWLYYCIVYEIWLYHMPHFICKLFGHRMVSDDYGNAESGYMGAHCERCGYSSGSQLH